MGRVALDAQAAQHSFGAARGALGKETLTVSQAERRLDRKLRSQNSHKIPYLGSTAREARPEQRERLAPNRERFRWAGP